MDGQLHISLVKVRKINPNPGQSEGLLTRQDSLSASNFIDLRSNSYKDI